MAGKKVQVCITVDEELMGWIEQKIKTMDFHNKSHAFELGVAKLRQMDNIRSSLLVQDDGSVLVVKDKLKELISRDSIHRSSRRAMAAEKAKAAENKGN